MGKENPHVEEYLKPQKIDPEKQTTMAELQQQINSRIMAGIKEKIESFVPSIEDIASGYKNNSYTFMTILNSYKSGAGVFTTKDGKHYSYMNKTTTYGGREIDPFQVELGNSKIEFTTIFHSDTTIDIEKKTISLCYIIDQIKLRIKEKIPDVEFKTNGYYYQIVFAK